MGKIVAGLCLLVLLGIGYAAYNWIRSTNVKYFRYTLEFELNYRGEKRFASSVIEVKYVIGETDLVRYVPYIKGVVPLIHIEGVGSILSALEMDVADISKTMRRLGLDPGAMGQNLPLAAWQIPLSAYNKNPEMLSKETDSVTLDRYPVLIWIPDNDDWRSARQLIPMQLPEIDRELAFSRLVVHPTPNAKLVDSIEPAPNWLIDLRNAQREGVTRPAGVFVINKFMQIERS